MQPYKESLEHIKEELYLLDLRLRAALYKFNNPYMSEDQKALAGIVISDQEAQGLLKHDDSPSNDLPDDKYKRSKKQTTKLRGPNEQRLKKLLALIKGLENDIKKRKELSRKTGIHLTLDHVSRIFSLPPFEYYTLVVCLAPEVDLKYEKLYGYLLDDINKKRPTLELVLRIISGRFEERIRDRGSLLNSPLFKCNIIEHNEAHTSILTMPLKLADRVADYLLGVAHADGVLDGLIEIFQPQIKKMPARGYENQTTEIPSFGDLKANLARYLDGSLQVNHNQGYRDIGGAKASFIYLSGNDNSGKRTLVKSVLREINFKFPLLILDLSPSKDLSTSIDEIFTAFKTEAYLMEASVYVDNIDSLILEENESKNIQIVKNALRHLNEIAPNRIIFIAGNDDVANTITSIHPRPPNLNFLQLKMPDLSVQDRIHLWKFFLRTFNLTLNGKIDEVERIASKFNFSVGQIKDAINTAINTSRYRETDQSVERILPKDLNSACFYESNTKLGKVSAKMEKDFCLKDIVLPSDRMKQLKEIINFVENKNKVYIEWGFKAKMGLGSGLNILLTGESGTGKTMAAQIVANELKVEIFKIDLSLLVSKYIGETEKNINRIFHEAKTSNALIFFDEADAIFGKRTEIKDAHDRYANIEVSYLLQKLEEHNEIVILASNLKHNIDDAFVRRMHFIVEFPFPDEKERLEIWRNVFPELSKGLLDKETIDFEFLARQFKTSGAMIRDIALSAAFLAAAESSNIKMEHMIRATKRELEKKGKPILKADFEKYYDLIQETPKGASN